MVLVTVSTHYTAPTLKQFQCSIHANQVTVALVTLKTLRKASAGASHSPEVRDQSYLQQIACNYKSIFCAYDFILPTI